MIRKPLNIASILVLAAFLWPSVAKLEHHHQKLQIFENEDVPQFHVFQEKCSICNFEFFVFSSETETFDLRCDKPADSYCEHYCREYFPTETRFSFFLRGPPSNQV